MESLVEGKRVDEDVNDSFQQQFNTFMDSSKVLQLLTNDSYLLQDYVLQTLLKKNTEVGSALIIKAHKEFSAERLLEHLRDHWKLLTPVNTSGFRAGLDDLLSCYHKQIKQGVLIITEADQLPIATQAALMHLVYLQEEKGLALKVILLAKPVALKKLKIFRPDGVENICLDRNDKAFTQWLVQKIIKECYVQSEQIPADIVDLAHNFSHGDPDEIRWIIEKWFSAADSAHRKQKKPSIDDVLEVPVAISKIKSSFWNRRTAMSGMMMLAVSVGLVTHGLNRETGSHKYLSGWHASKHPSYAVELLDTTDRIEALQWIAHHPGLANEQVVSDRDASGATHYHVAFGKFATQAEVSSALKKFKANPQYASAHESKWSHA